MKISRQKAIEIGMRFITTHLANTYEEIQMAGLVRLEKKAISHLDLIVLPTDAATFLARTDILFIRGDVRQSQYAAYWTSVRRFIIYEELHIDIHLADKHNWGFKMWYHTDRYVGADSALRTLTVPPSPYTLLNDNIFMGDKKVSIPDERAMFVLIGKQYMFPRNRMMTDYDTGIIPMSPETAVYVENTVPVQTSMF